MNRIAIASLMVLVGTTAASAQFSLFQPIVSRVGNGGATTLVNTGNDVFLDQYAATGANQASPGFTVALPTATTTAAGFTNSGTATSEALLTMSGGANPSIVIGGYSFKGSTSIVSSASSTNPRRIASVDITGAVTLGAGLTNTHTANNIRSAVSSDGTQYWTAGANEGVRWATDFADTTTDVISSTSTNNRVLNIFDSQLYVSTGSGSRGIYTVGTGLPNSGSNTAVRMIDTGAASSPYDFLLFDLNPNVAGVDTAYIADDTATGGVQRWTYNGSAWSLTYTIGTGASGARGLAGYLDGAGGLVMFATTGEATNRLVRIDELLSNVSGSATVTTLATAGANQAFRGVEVFVPTPGAAALLGLGTLMAGRRRR